MLNSEPFPGSLATLRNPCHWRDDAVHGRKAEAGPPALFLRREERVEDALAGIFVHPRPGISHRQTNVGARPAVTPHRQIGRCDLDVAGFDASVVHPRAWRRGH